MEEIPGLVDELLGMRHALEQVFSEHSYEQNIHPRKRTRTETLNDILPAPKLRKIVHKISEKYYASS